MRRLRAWNAPFVFVCYGCGTSEACLTGLSAVVDATPIVDSIAPGPLDESTSQCLPQLPIMVIAGDPNRLQVAQEVLIELELGWEVVFASNVDEVHEVLSARAVDLVLVDLSRSAWSPVELVESIHNRLPRLPIVAMSAPFGVHLALACVRKGASNHFPRELLDSEPHAVLETLRETARLGQWRRHESRSLQNLYFEFRLGNDRELVPAIVERLAAATVEAGLCDRPAAVRLGVAVEEGLLNAILHGNLEVSSELRQVDESRFHREVERRRNLAPYRDRHVQVTARVSAREAVISIVDEGPGFDVANLPDPTNPENLLRVGGRGVLLMRAFMSEVRYNQRGNAVTLIKRCS